MKNSQRLNLLLQSSVFGGWTATLIYLLVTQNYRYFLRLEFGILLATAHLISMGFLLTVFANDRVAKIDLSAILRSLILLIPLIYLITMPYNTLGNSAFRNRFIGQTTLPIHSNFSQKQMAAPEQKEANDTQPDKWEKASEDTKAQASPKELTILEILLNPQPYHGHQVTITGMLMHDESLKQYFGGKDIIIYRFLITCCAADAQPLAIGLDLNQKTSIKNINNGGWVQATGIFELRNIKSRPVPFIKNATLQMVEQPAIPYLF